MAELNVVVDVTVRLLDIEVFHDVIMEIKLSMSVDAGVATST
jgi:hypothetical protein